MSLRGMVLAVADGVGGAAGGRVAAETCVRSFIEAYYNLPATLGVEQVAARILASVNGWIHNIGQRDPVLANMMTTFSALILQGRQAHLIHVGDTRIYRFRNDRLEKLTEDHTLKSPDLAHVLYRAVGIESEVRADFAKHALEMHDRFLICSDGVYGTLREAVIQGVLAQRESPQRSAEALVERALEQGSQDNLSAVVVDIVAVPPASRSLLQDQIDQLPLLELPVIGEMIDGFYLSEVLSDGHYSRLFIANDTLDGRQRVVVKFPHPRVTSEQAYQQAFLREAWIGARVKNPWVAEVVELTPGRQSRLYSVFPFYPGETLEKRISHQQKPALEAGCTISVGLCKAAHALHRQRIIHRDIKPDNILLPSEGGLKLLDLGVARLPAWNEDGAEPIPGTPSYMAPEQFAGERGNEKTDVFAIGVTLYRMFASGAYPYGEIEPFSTPRFGKPKSLTLHRPDLPAWLDAVLAKALAVNSDDRYADAMELAFEIENGLAKGGQVRSQKPPFYARNPVLFWQLFSLILFGLLILSHLH